MEVKVVTSGNSGTFNLQKIWGVATQRGWWSMSSDQICASIDTQSRSHTSCTTRDSVADLCIAIFIRLASCLACHVVVESLVCNRCPWIRERGGRGCRVWGFAMFCSVHRNTNKRMFLRLKNGDFLSTTGGHRSKKQENVRGSCRWIWQDGFVFFPSNRFSLPVIYVPELVQWKICRNPPRCLKPWNASYHWSFFLSTQLIPGTNTQWICFVRTFAGSDVSHIKWHTHTVTHVTHNLTMEQHHF